jgi:two-component system, NarL family, sensor histidine kinase DesK
MWGMSPLPGEALMAERPTLGLMRARLGVLLGLLFLAGPVSDLLSRSYATLHISLLLAGCAVFVAIYGSLLPPARWLARRGERALVLALALLPAIAVALLAAGAPSSFAALFVYFVAAAGILLPARAAMVVVAATALGIAIGGVALEENAGAVSATVLTVLAIGALMGAFGRIARANRELDATRGELARLAVSDERLRFARDLHDLLGHSLSVIALKSELAARLVDSDPKRAASELRDIQSVTRGALAEVREAVQGYRRIALSEAVSSARAALAAAGIDLQLADARPELPEEVDTVLAWAVREGTTNIIRHSDARHCAIRIHADEAAAAVEIEDDGSAPAVAAPAPGGSGLVGLRERAERLRGTIETGALPGGGFRLALTVPLGEP